MSISLSDSLVNRIKALRTQEGKDSLMLRVTVNSGGCQGFEYSFDLTDQSNPQEDEVFEKDGVAVVIDEVSLGFLNGAEIHYKDDLMESKFEIRNPNATSSCGCGTSFSV
jgi:iron-sulfur cluster insertion protein